MAKFRGQTEATALALVVIAVTMIIGIYVYSSIYGNINTSALDATAQSTITSVNSTVYSGFNLLVILIIVLAAAAVLGGVYLLRGRG